MKSLNNFVPLRQQPESSSNKCGDQYKKIHTPSSSSDNLRNRHGIEVEGENIPDPIQSFEEILLPNRMLNFLKRSKLFTKPTPIQMQAIGCLLQSRDVICLSPTGSGKTYGYLLPLCCFLWKHRDSFNSFDLVKPICLIVVPTRELMHQVHNSAKELLQNLNLPQETNPNHMTSLNGSSKLNSYNVYPPYQAPWDYQQQPPGNYHHHPGNYPQQLRRYNLSDGIRPPFVGNQVLFSGNNHILRHPWNYNQALDHRNMQLLPYNNHQGNPLRFPSFHHTQQSQLNDTSNSINESETVVGICGGVPIKEDLAILSTKTKVIVATPGRLLDLCDRGELDLQEVRYFVIDECDKSLEMGMEEQLRKIVAMVTINEKTILQTSLWSATLPESLERLARSAVVDPVYICTGVKDTVPVNIQQNVLFLHTYQKNKVLLEVLRNNTPFPPVIVFASSKQKVDDVTEFLQSEQFHAAAMHSGKNQSYRNDVMDAFRQDGIDILVATDLVSRGLDIPAITHVIHYDTPDSVQDYIHRSGRTGRFGREGVSTTFLTLDCKIASELKELFESTNTNIPPQLKDVKMFGKNVLCTDMGDRVI